MLVAYKEIYQIKCIRLFIRDKRTNRPIIGFDDLFYWPFQDYIRRVNTQEMFHTLYFILLSGKSPNAVSHEQNLRTRVLQIWDYSRCKPNRCAIEGFGSGRTSFANNVSPVPGKYAYAWPYRSSSKGQPRLLIHVFQFPSSSLVRRFCLCPTAPPCVPQIQVQKLYSCGCSDGP